MDKAKMAGTTIGKVGYFTRFLFVAVRDSAFISAYLEGEKMTNTLDMVHDFHKAFDVPMADRPQMPRPNNVALTHLYDYAERAKEMASEMLINSRGDDSGLIMRLHLCMEELSELARAMAHGNPVEALDALADMRYVADGTILHLGFGDVFNEAMDEVHASNMSKLVGGRPVKNEVGRVLKPETYFKPNLTALAYDGMETA